MDAYGFLVSKMFSKWSFSSPRSLLLGVPSFSAFILQDVAPNANIRFHDDCLGNVPRFISQDYGTNHL